MGTPSFAVPALETIAGSHEVLCVYCQPPRAAGRGKRERPTPVQLAAEAMGLPLRHPPTLRLPEVQAAFSALRADVAVVVAYGLILPPAILAMPAAGCLNIHASLLPRWRGAAPIHRAIIAGDPKTGVCIMQMDEGLDTGAVLLRRSTPIGPEETVQDLLDRLSLIGSELIAEVLSRLPGLVAKPQAAEGVTYATKIDKAETRIDWTQPATGVDRLIRGMSPFPGAWCDMGGARVKLLRSRVVAGRGAPGAVLHGMTVACGSEAVEILQAQREGRQPVPAEAFLRGFVMPDRLG